MNLVDKSLAIFSYGISVFICISCLNMTFKFLHIAQSFLGLLLLLVIVSACAVGCKPHSTCKDSDKGLNADVKYFQLTDIIITDDVMERMMEKLLLLEKNLREKHIQSATLIRTETTGMVST